MRFLPLTLPFIAVVGRSVQFATGGIRTHDKDALLLSRLATVAGAHHAGSCGTVPGRCLPSGGAFSLTPLYPYVKVSMVYGFAPSVRSFSVLLPSGEFSPTLTTQPFGRQPGMFILELR